MLTAEELIDKVKEPGDPGEAMDLLYEWFDKAMQSGLLPTVERAMTLAKTELSVTQLLGVLTITLPVRSAVASVRDDLVREVYGRFREKAEARARLLLKGLE